MRVDDVGRGFIENLPERDAQLPHDVELLEHGLLREPARPAIDTVELHVAYRLAACAAGAVLRARNLARRDPELALLAQDGVTAERISALHGQ